MYIIKLTNEFLHGPVWVYNSNGIVSKKCLLVENDPIITELNSEAEKLFSSYYEFNSHNSPCWFNHDKEKREKDKMLALISKIKSRLNEINDGSFVVEDYETERLHSL